MRKLEFRLTGSPHQQSECGLGERSQQAWHLVEIYSLGFRVQGLGFQGLGLGALGLRCPKYTVLHKSCRRQMVLHVFLLVPQISAIPCSCLFV